jgi:carboxymethylenebutenolidase
MRRAYLWMLFLSLAAPANAQPRDLAERIRLHPPRPELAPGQAPAENVSYRSGGFTLKGEIYKPKGAGPFPAVIWNHGSNKMPGPQPELAAFFNSKRFVFFAPLRHGHGGLPGDYIVDLNDKLFAQHPVDEREAWKRMVPLHDVYNADVAAAVQWLKSQPFIDSQRIIMSGVSYGGIQTLIAAEKGMDVRAFISFAPAAMSWRMIDLRQRLQDAVNHATAPIFLLQAANDYSTGPAEVLGAALRKKSGLNQAKVYPAFGGPDEHQLGHSAFATWNLGTEIWGTDVMAFIDAALRSR